MKPKILDLLALTIITAGSTHLLTGAASAQISPPTAEPGTSCCTSGDGNATCCGKNGCSADATTCEAA